MNSISISALMMVLQNCASIELKFELEDNRKDCFYEEITVPGDNMDISFMVIDGGNRDVTFEAIGPNKEDLAKKVRSRDGVVNIKALKKGIYTFCFSNEFSSFTHKLVYFEMNTESVVRERELKNREIKKEKEEQAQEAVVTMTSVEGSLYSLSKNIERGQRSLRVFRKWNWLADLHSSMLRLSVNGGSGVVIVTIVIVGLLQTCFLRSLFSEKNIAKHLKSTRPYTTPLYT